ncbi:hypothetical protein [Bradyrhizobium sp. 604_D8_N2_3]|uniref:hypothetical protein n=1 Tax=Bradyrhizobium sp. 604_D8_N2_3 TaxID=3240370 RepID=UPI003F1F0142
MARPEVTGKKLGSDAEPMETPQQQPSIQTPQQPSIQTPQQLAMSVAQFCKAHGFSVAMFYKMKRQDRKLVPRQMTVGNRTLITIESAAAWRAARDAVAEAESSAPPQTTLATGPAKPPAAPATAPPVKPQKAPATARPAKAARLTPTKAKPARGTRRAEGASA